MANVARETSHGDAGLEIQRGLKHFAPGARVWVLPKPWGGLAFEDRHPVVGRHRGSSRWINVVIDRRHLENFRVKGVYSYAAHAAMKGQSWPDRENAEFWADHWNIPRIEAWFQARHREPVFGEPPLYDIQYEGLRFLRTSVTDPPSAELEFDGTPYHLAQVSPQRAIYCISPPPAEPPVPESA